MEAPQGAKDTHCECGVKLYPLTGVIIMLYALWALWEKRYIRNRIIIIIIIIKANEIKIRFKTVKE